ncbi:MAG: aldo/keto reductase [Thermodesulfobacteriota bacterium]
MEYTNIPGLEMQVTRVALGTWAIGGWMWGGTDEGESIKTIHAALESGINIIDTAPVYGFGVSEEIVGKAVDQFGGRDKVALATKVALEWDAAGKKVWRNSSPERLRQEVENSLRRLRTDYIDIYQIHWPDPVVAFEETAETMAQLKQEGKIRSIGVSNYTTEQMDRFSGKAELAVCQPPYNIFERAIENDILPYCRKKGIATLTYGALCRGMLSGKMTRDREFPGDDLRNVDPKFKTPRFDQYLAAVDKLQDFVRTNYGKNVLQLAVRYVLDKGSNVALWGARHPEELDPLADIFGWHLEADALQEIDRIVESTVTDPVGPGFMAPPSRKG